MRSRPKILRNASRALATVACGALALLAVQCSGTTTAPSPSPAAPAASTAAPAAPQPDPVAEAKAAWPTIYAVLQHPRCLNCHPSDRVPKQGDDRLPHAQNVQGGADGHGRFAMRCEACHREFNLLGPHLPPGAPGWHMPSSKLPLVFEGTSSAQLCRQLRDPARNGGLAPEQVLEHMRTPLVLWGWDPGPGRAPVPIAHAEFLRAVRAWIDGGCGCPD